MASRKSIRIDVISDFICAWCYVGHIELEKALALARSHDLPVDFSIQYHPFILNSHLPEDQPLSKDEYFKRKFCSAEKRDEILSLLTVRAKEEGLNLSFRGNIRQTTRAHRLLQKAYLYGGQRAQTALIKRLFRAFFEDEKDVGDAGTLAKLASAQTYPFTPLATTNGINGSQNSSAPEITVTKIDGADYNPHEDDDAAAIFDSEEDALAWVQGNEFEKEVRAMSLDAARKGVQGVPFTIIDGRWAVSGCQKPECYLKIFEKLAYSDSLCSAAQTPRGEEGPHKVISCNKESCPAV